jgi:hypothetical protein
MRAGVVDVVRVLQCKLNVSESERLYNILAVQFCAAFLCLNVIARNEAICASLLGNPVIRSTDCFVPRNDVEGVTTPVDQRQVVRQVLPVFLLCF